MNFAAVGSCAPAGFSDVMNREKLNWYRELLAVEPSSRIFFPYARHLASMNMTKEAVIVLRHGLSLYPDFVEARLLLIEELRKSGASGLCAEEVARLAVMFRKDPAFLHVWERNVKRNTPSEEARNFCSAMPPRHESSLSGSGAPSACAAAAVSSGEESAALPSSLTSFACSGNAPEKSGAFPSFPGERPETGEGLSAGEKGQPSAAPLPDLRLSGKFSAPVFAAAPDKPGKCSLRTRSMADILAEQGDIPAAIEIYEELAASAQPAERESLLSRIASLNSSPEGGAADAEDSAGTHTSAPISGVMAPSSGSSVSALGDAGAEVADLSKEGVLDMLENLAVRLENRAR